MSVHTKRPTKRPSVHFTIPRVGSLHTPYAWLQQYDGRHVVAGIANVCHGALNCRTWPTCTKPSEVIWVENICQKCTRKGAVTARSRFMSARARGIAIALLRLHLPTERRCSKKGRPKIHRTLHKCNS